MAGELTSGNRHGRDQTQVRKKIKRWPKRTVENREWQWARPTLDTSIRNMLSPKI